MSAYPPVEWFSGWTEFGFADPDTLRTGSMEEVRPYLEGLHLHPGELAPVLTLVVLNLLGCVGSLEDELSDACRVIARLDEELCELKARAARLGGVEP